MKQIYSMENVYFIDFSICACKAFDKISSPKQNNPAGLDCFASQWCDVVMKMYFFGYTVVGNVSVSDEWTDKRTAMI